MKIQCDVCNKDEASVFCSADEVALCDTCNHRVHHANKLASKHQRFSLLHPSPKQFPLCDICQEKRAFLFCQQDRAILCRDCDVPIHTANEHTQKHNRFLLTGVKLSATSALYSSPTAATTTTTASCDSVPDLKSQPLINNSNKKQKPVIGSVSPPPQISNHHHHTPSIEKTSSNSTITTVNNKGGDHNLLTNDVGGTSSISEYLIETLPGWHVEDFLDSSSAPFGFCKTDDGVLPFVDADFESNLSSFSSESMGIWVPQAPPPSQTSQYSSNFGGQIRFKETKEGTSMKSSNRRLWMDDGFTVPQVSPPSIGSKRSSPFW